MNGRCNKAMSLRLLPWMVVALLLLHPRLLLLLQMGNGNASVLLFVQGRFQHPRQQRHHPRYYHHDDDQHRDRDHRRRRKLNPRGWFLPANRHSHNISNSNQTTQRHHRPTANANAAAAEETTTTTTTATVGAAPAHPRTAATTTTTILSVVGGAAAAASSSDEEQARNDVRPEEDGASSSQQDHRATATATAPSLLPQQGEPATPEQQQQPAAFVSRSRHPKATTGGAATTSSSTITTTSNTKAITTLLSHLVLVLRALGPALVAVFGSGNSSNQQQHLLPFRSVCAWTLAGTSLGFYRFLYFLSLGYCSGIGTAVLACLVQYLRQVPAPFRSATAVLHSALVVAWAARLFAYLWWREHRGWPALHRKMVQVDRARRPGHPQRIACWLLCSLLYACLLSPCWFRLEADYRRSLLLLRTTTATAARRGNGSGKVVSAAGLTLQVTGLLLEGVADWQKSRFKAQQRRHQWCRDGLWRHSTHPNYAGEFLFWLGTAIAALPAVLLGTTASVVGNGNSSISRRHMSAAVPLVQLAVVLLGLAFLSAALAGAAQRLGDKQMARYGGDPDYVSHRERTGVFGPKRWWWWLPTEENNNSNNSNSTTTTAVGAVDALDRNETAATTTTGETPPKGTATDEAA